LEHDECQFVTLATVDALLSGLDCPEEMTFLYPLDSQAESVGYQVLDPHGVLETGP
jgi:hypothetical protein